MHCLILLFVDLVLISAASLAAISLAVVDVSSAAILDLTAYCLVTLAASVPVLLLFRLNRTVWRFTSLSDGVRVTLAVAAIIALTLLLEWLSGGLAHLPRIFPVIQGLLVLYALAGARVAMRIRHDLRRRARHSKSIATGSRENVLIVGLNPLADLFLHCTARNGHSAIDIVGILSNADRHRGRWLRSRKILGPPEAIEAALHDLAVHGIFVDRIVLASSLNELSERARTALGNIEKSGAIRVQHLSALYGLSDGTSAAHENIEDSGVGVQRPSISFLRWKRFIDATAALIVLVGVSPLMVGVCIAALLDVGWPAIFWQQRPGAYGRPIKVLKFRTMGPPRDRDGRRLSDIERVSNVGRLLRRLRLDELPQLYNVLLGHMSLVGPRPLLPVDQPSAPAARLRLRPGLTGWAQINGGRHLSSEDKAALDLWYIKNASVTLDIRILAHTVHMVLFGERVDQGAVQQAWQALRNDQAALLAVDAVEHDAILTT